MTVQESKTCVIIIESNCNTTLVATLTPQSCLDLGGTNVIYPILMLISCEQYYEAANHGLLSKAHVSVSFAQRIRDDLLPEIDFLTILALEDRFGV
jgi:hypothetical protein